MPSQSHHSLPHTHRTEALRLHRLRQGIRHRGPAAATPGRPQPGGGGSGRRWRPRRWRS